MNNLKPGNPSAHQAVHTLPIDAALLAATAQRLPPIPSHRTRVAFAEGANAANPPVILFQLELSEDYLTAIRKNAAARTRAVTVAPQDDPKQTDTGKLAVMDNTVDTTTGTIRLKATFENAKGTLWPGQFVTVSLALWLRGSGRMGA